MLKERTEALGQSRFPVSKQKHQIISTDFQTRESELAVFSSSLDPISQRKRKTIWKM